MTPLTIGIGNITYFIGDIIIQIGDITNYQETHGPHRSSDEQYV